ncbi:MAG: PAS domain S-box protein, partial [Thermodesulfobacteriota bacterium]
MPSNDQVIPGRPVGPWENLFPWPRIVFITALIVLIPLWWMTGQWFKGRLMAEERSRSAVKLRLHGEVLASAVNRRLGSFAGLYTFVQSHPSEKALVHKFDLFAAGLHGGSRGIRNFGVAPGGILRFVYPLAGNEKALGHDLLHDPLVKNDVGLAIKTADLVLSGPYELRQGGLGLVARKAVFVQGRFWGLVTMVIDIPPILEEAGLSLDLPIMETAIRDGQGRIFFGKSGVFAGDPVIYPIALMKGKWELAAIPEQGWEAAVRWQIFLFRGISLLSVLLVLGLVAFIVNRGQTLRQRVQERTRGLLRSNEALRESEEYNRKLFDISPVGLVLCTMDGTLIQVNQAYVGIIGRSIEETLKLSYWDITPEKYARQEQIQLESLRASGRYGPYEKEYIHRNGSLVPVRLQGLLVEKDGQPFIWSSVEDISEQRKAEERIVASERKYRELVENANSIILRWTPEGIITFLNEYGLKFFDFPEAEIIGRHVVGTIVPETETTGRDMQPLMEAILADPGQFEQNVNENRRRNGEPVWIAWTNKVALDAAGRIKEILSIGTDITQRKKAEEEIKSLTRDLEQRVVERTSQLNDSQRALMSIVEDLNEKTAELEQANLRLQELDQLKSMFIASMSHELRTPLNSVIGFSSILLDEWVGPLTTEQKENLAIILRSGKHLLALINDVIDISKIEADKIDIQFGEVDVYEVISEVIATYKKEIRDKGLDLQVDFLHQIMVTDRRRLLQSLLNLVSNAVKFTEKGFVRLTARTVRGSATSASSVESFG